MLNRITVTRRFNIASKGLGGIGFNRKDNRMWRRLVWGEAPAAILDCI
jgi:hypothetical protein